MLLGILMVIPSTGLCSNTTRAAHLNWTLLLDLAALVEGRGADLCLLVHAHEKDGSKADLAQEFNVREVYETHSKICYKSL